MVKTLVAREGTDVCAETLRLDYRQEQKKPAKMIITRQHYGRPPWPSG